MSLIGELSLLETCFHSWLMQDWGVLVDGRIIGLRSPDDELARSRNMACNSPAPQIVRL